MPVWLTSSVSSGQDLQLTAHILRISLAFVLGGAVAALYWLTHRRDETLAWSFVTTLVLLSILIAMVTQVIGDSVARAFSLVGALSIVRFRTVVADTRDTAFVILSVVVGMAIGAGHIEVALIGLVIVGVASAAMRLIHATPNGSVAYWNLNLRVAAGCDPENFLREMLPTHFLETNLQEVSTGRQGTTLSLSYKVRLRPNSSPTSVVTELHQHDAIQSIELESL